MRHHRINIAIVLYLVSIFALGNIGPCAPFESFQQETYNTPVLQICSIRDRLIQFNQIEFGDLSEFSESVVCDKEGFIYLAGEMNSPYFPTTTTLVTSDEPENRLFVAKLSVNGSMLLYSFVFGGTGQSIGGIAVDNRGCVYVTGEAAYGDFPTTEGAFDTTHSNGFDVFVMKISPEGNNMVYSTFLGGSGDDYGHDITVTDAGHAVIVGETASNDYPTTPNAFDGTYNGERDVFVTKLNPDGSGLVYSTFLGGSQRDDAWGVSFSDEGYTYISGNTESTDFPTTAGAYDRLYDGTSYCAFVSKLSTNGSFLLYSTFLGEGSTVARDIAVDASGNAYITGWTEDLPTTNGSYSTEISGSYDAFVTKLNPEGNSLVYSTFLGGGNGEDAKGIAIDSQGCAYITGWTKSDDFPTTYYDLNTGASSEYKVFVSRINQNGDDLDFSLLISGEEYQTATDITMDKDGSIIITGFTNSHDYPITDSVYDDTFNGGSDCFITKLNQDGTELIFSTFLGNESQNLNPNQFHAIIIVVIVSLTIVLIWNRKRKRTPPSE